MSAAIKITGRGADLVSYLRLVNFQGDLKVLSEVAYQKIRTSIIKFGFMEPISVWIDGDKLKMLNGHQRLAAVKRMIENEGFDPADLPINYIQADSYHDAKLRVLALTSEYGQMTQAGAVNFLADMDLTSESLMKFIELRQIDINSVLSQIGEVRLNLPQVDPLDVGNMVIGGENLAPVTAEEAGAGQKPVKNDTMSGMRLMQIFLTTDQLEDVKSKIDMVIEHYRLENMTEAILKAVDMTVEIMQVKESNATNKSKPAKKSKK